MAEQKKINPFFPPLAAVVFFALLDAVIRFPYLKTYSGTDAVFHLFSVVYEYLFLFIVLRVFTRGKAAGTALFVLYLLTVLGSYNFYFYFSTLPGINTFSYFFLSPANSLGIMRDGFNYLPFLVGAAISCGMIYWMMRGAAGMGSVSRGGAAGAGITFLVLTLVMHNNLKLKDNRTMPFTNAVFSLKHGYADFRNAGKIDQIGSRTFHITPPAAKLKAGFNVLFIMNESLSPYYCMGYSGKYRTDEKLAAMMESRKNEFFVFNNAWSNSTITAVSLPFTIAGMNPLQGKHELIRVPLLYDYLKAYYSNVRTAYLTSWSYDDYPNFKAFFNSPTLDSYIYREKIKAPKVVDMGTDDSVITTYFRAFTKQLRQGEKFFAVVHYSNTHFPYYSPPGFSTLDAPSEIVRNYINSVRFLDKNQGDIFKTLSEQGLLENTVIVATSDHSECLGEHTGEKGHFGKYSAFKNRVPAWVFVPAGLQAGISREQLRANTGMAVSNNDIMPTLYDFYKIPPPAFFTFGSSLAGALNPGRVLYIYNGKGENRTDSKEYFGAITGGMLFLQAKDHSGSEFNLFNLSDEYQRTDLWPGYAGKDSLLRVIRRGAQTMPL